MLEDKIKELRNYGFSLEDITRIVISYYNKNPYELWLFEPINYDKMKKLVIDVLLTIS